MGDIQFTPLNPTPKPVSEPPAWLRALVEWLTVRLTPLVHWLAIHIRTIEIFACILLIMLLGWALVRGSLTIFKRPRRQIPAEDSETWRPDAAMAAALLSDADQLAATGRFAEAVHLLLRRSFDYIAQTRPDWLTPASTAREIALLTALPLAARTAFGVIAREVERSRYALRPLDHPDWIRARAAYVAFAVPGRAAS